MAIVTPSDDILVAGPALYAFQASAAISGASLVMPAGPMQVVTASINCNNAVGVAYAEVQKGKYLTVYGPGCIVRCCASSAITVGDDLYAAATGKVHAGATYGSPSGCVGIALEGAEANGAVRVLLK